MYNITSIDVVLLVIHMNLMKVRIGIMRDSVPMELTQLSEAFGKNSHMIPNIICIIEVVLKSENIRFEGLKE